MTKSEVKIYSHPPLWLKDYSELLHCFMLGWLLFNKCNNGLERKLGSEMATSANGTISQVTQVQYTLCGELQKRTLRTTAVDDTMSNEIQQ